MLSCTRLVVRGEELLDQEPIGDAVVVLPEPYKGKLLPSSSEVMTIQEAARFLCILSRTLERYVREASIPMGETGIAITQVVDAEPCLYAKDLVPLTREEGGRPAGAQKPGAGLLDLEEGQGPVLLVRPRRAPAPLPSSTQSDEDTS